MAEVSSVTPHIHFPSECAHRVANLPSEVMFQVEMLPQTLSLPSSKMSARLTGGLLNLVHLCVCISRIRKVPESVTGWEEMYMESEDQPWFDWVCPIFLRFSSLGISNNQSIYHPDVPYADPLDQCRGLEFHIPLLSHAHL